MSLISTVELAAMRAVQLTTLTQTCTITRVTNDSGSSGRPSETASTVGSGVACRLAIASQQSQLDTKSTSGQKRTPTEFVLKVAHNQDIATGDTVVIDSSSYRVEGVLENHQWSMLKQCKVTAL